MIAMGAVPFGVVVGTVVSVARQAQTLRRLEAAVDRVATTAPPDPRRSHNVEVEPQTEACRGLSARTTG